jgi:hypothetical protein
LGRLRFLPYIHRVLAPCNNPVQFTYAETRGIGKHRHGIESGKSAPGKQPPPCGRGSRRAGEVGRRKVRNRVASQLVSDGAPKDGNGAEGTLGEGPGPIASCNQWQAWQLAAKAHSFGSRSAKDCRGTTGAMGKSQGGAGEVKIARVLRGFMTCATLKTRECPQSFRIRGHSGLLLRQPERSQLASPWGPW